MVNKAFEVESVVVCDYSTQDANGKQIQVGIFDHVVVRSTEATNMQPFSIVVGLKPIHPEFEFVIELLGPNNIGIIRGQFTVKYGKNPSDVHRVNINFAVPSIPFPGMGEYTVLVRLKNEKVVFRRVYNFVDGENLESQDAEISASASINADLLSRIQKK